MTFKVEVEVNADSNICKNNAQPDKRIEMNERKMKIEKK